MKKVNKTIFVGCRCRPEIKDKLIEMAEHEEITVSQIIRKAIQEKIKESYIKRE